MKHTIRTSLHALVPIFLLLFGMAGFAATPAAAAGLVNKGVFGTLADGGKFVGTARITALKFVQVGQGSVIAAEGVLNGTATNADGSKKTLQNVKFMAPINVAQVGPNLGPKVCQILDLDIGAIHLDLLGLIVDLAPIDLDITAQSGPGQLLGNLLCGLAHLLDGEPTFDQLNNVINKVNNALNSL